MKRGANYVLLTRLDVELGRVSNIIFTFKGIASKIQKSYPEEVTVDGDLFAIKLFQEDTVKFSGEVLLEAQINYTDGAVAKSNITSVFFDRTLNTEIVEGNEPTGTDAEVHFSVVGNVIIGKIIGEVDPEVIEAAVKDYLDKHPIPTYDDSEIREEIKQVKESIPAPYDDSEIRQELTEINTSLSELDERVEELEKKPSSGYISGGEHTLVVGKGTSFKYNTIASAVADAQDGDTILIYDGEYEESQLGRGKVLHFIGVNKQTCIVYNGWGDKDYSVFDFSKGGSVRNLTIHQTDLNPKNPDIASVAYKAYCVHSDASSCENTTVIVENCILKNKCFACVGLGMWHNHTVIVKDCDIDTYDVNPYNKEMGAFYCHSNTTTTGITGQKIRLLNNYIHGHNTQAIKVDISKMANSEMIMEFVNNTCVSDLYGVEDTCVSLSENEYTSIMATSHGNNNNRINKFDSSPTPTPTVKTLSSISATKTKTSYEVSETLNIDDIVVTASYSDGTSATVSGWTTNASSIDMNSEGTKTLTVSYTENSVTKTTDISITVSGVAPTPSVLEVTRLQSIKLGTTQLEAKASSINTYMVNVEPNKTYYITAPSTSMGIQIAFNNTGGTSAGTSISGYKTFANNPSNKDLTIPDGMTYLYMYNLNGGAVTEFTVATQPI